MENKYAMTLVGVASFDVGSEHFNFFAKVTYYKLWIDKIIREDLIPPFYSKCVIELTSFVKDIS